MIGRFDANSYLVLSEAMNHYDLGRGYGGPKRLLSQGAGRGHRRPGSPRTASTRSGCSGSWPSSSARATCEVVESGVGHDGFLVEHEAGRRARRARRSADSLREARRGPVTRT